MSGVGNNVTSLLLIIISVALTTVLLLFMSDALTTTLLLFALTSGALTSASILNMSTSCLHSIFGCSLSKGPLIGVAVGGKGYVFAGRGDHGFCFALAGFGE